MRMGLGSGRKFSAVVGGKLSIGGRALRRRGSDMARGSGGTAGQACGGRGQDRAEGGVGSMGLTWMGEGKMGNENGRHYWICGIRDNERARKCRWRSVVKHADDGMKISRRRDNAKNEM